MVVVCKHHRHERCTLSWLLPGKQEESSHNAFRGRERTLPAQSCRSQQLGGQAQRGICLSNCTICSLLGARSSFSPMRPTSTHLARIDVGHDANVAIFVQWLLAGGSSSGRSSRSHGQGAASAHSLGLSTLGSLREKHKPIAQPQNFSGGNTQRRSTANTPWGPEREEPCSSGWRRSQRGSADPP